MAGDSLSQIRSYFGALTLTFLLVATILPYRAYASGAHDGDDRDDTITRLPAESESTRWIGAMFDVGAPDLMTAALVVRPWYWARLHVGAMTDFFSAGVRGGVTLVPFNYWITPSFTAEVGHMFDGNANFLTNRMFNLQSALLNRVGYDFVNAQIGLELGSPNRFMFFLRGGISVVTATVHNLAEVMQQSTNDSSISLKDPKMKYVGPSGKLGFVWFI